MCLEKLHPLVCLTYFILLLVILAGSFNPVLSGIGLVTAIMAMITRPDPDPLVHDMFQKTMHWLMDSSKGNMGYNAFNLLIYVLLMPSAILSSIIICCKSFRKSNRPTD